MVDPADFTMPDTPSEPNTANAGGELPGSWKHLPAVLQLVSRGPGNMQMVCVAEARMYLDDVTGENPQQHD